MLTEQAKPGFATARACLRVSLGGGGTDVPWYLHSSDGSALTATIRAGVSVEIAFSKSSRGHSDWTRTALNALGVSPDRLEVKSVSDVPPGSGLGSSGAYLSALVAGLWTLQDRSFSPYDVAEEATRLEQLLSGDEAGPQDPWASALGGVRRLSFTRAGTKAEEPKNPHGVRTFLDQHLLLMHSGITRSAASELQSQRRVALSTPDARADLDRVKELGFEIEDSLVRGDIDAFVACIREHSLLKARRSVVPEAAKEMLRVAEAAGARAAKIVGAGGGGAILFIFDSPENRRRILSSLKDSPAFEVHGGFSDDGVKARRFE